MNNNWMHGEGSSYDRFQLLRFWGQHPNTHFNLPSLHAAMAGDLVDVGEALAPLVEEGIVKQERDPHGVVIYSLAPDAQVRDSVEALSQMDWEHIQKRANGSSYLRPARNVLA